jgi:hypothetical protein
MLPASGFIRHSAQVSFVEVGGGRYLDNSLYFGPLRLYKVLLPRCSRVVCLFQNSREYLRAVEGTGPPQVVVAGQAHPVCQQVPHRHLGAQPPVLPRQLPHATVPTRTGTRAFSRLVLKLNFGFMMIKVWGFMTILGMG